MRKEVKIIIDDKGLVHVWIDGTEQRHITKVTIDVDIDSVHYPHIIIEKDDFGINAFKDKVFSI